MVQPEHFVRFLQVQFHGVFGDAVGVFWLGHKVFAHRQLVAAVNRDGRCEHKTLHRAGVDRRVDEVHAADQIIRVVERLDEVAQSFGGVGGEMEDVIKLVLLEQLGDERLIFYLALDEFGAGGDVFRKSAR